MKIQSKSKIYSLVYSPSQCRCCLSCCGQWLLCPQLGNQVLCVPMWSIQPPAQVVPDAASVSAKSDLPSRTLSKKQSIQLFLQNRQTQHLKQAWILQTLQRKRMWLLKTKQQHLKKKCKAKPESKKETEDAVKPATNPAPAVTGQDREANEAQPATTPAEVQKAWPTTPEDTVDVPATYLDKANFLAHSQQVLTKSFHTDSSPEMVC